MNRAWSHGMSRGGALALAWVTAGLAGAPALGQGSHGGAPTASGAARPLTAVRTVPAARLREGSFLTGRRGRMSTDGSRWFFHFDAAAGAAQEPPMALMPCLTLMEMRRLVESRRETATFVLSGEVFEHGGRNYLMPMFFTVAGRETEAARAVDTPAAETPVRNAAGEPRAPSRDPSAEELISRVEQATAAKRTIERLSAPAGGEDGEVAKASLAREGEIVSARRARLVRASHNAWSVVFDNDPQTPEGVATSMRLLPCRTLERMEQLGARFGETLSLVVSGQVYVYEGENYLLPTVFRVDYSEGGEIRSSR